MNNTVDMRKYIQMLENFETQPVSGLDRAVAGAGVFIDDKAGRQIRSLVNPLYETVQNHSDRMRQGLMDGLSRLRGLPPTRELTVLPPPTNTSVGSAH